MSSGKNINTHAFEKGKLGVTVFSIMIKITKQYLKSNESVQTHKNKEMFQVVKASY